MRLKNFIQAQIAMCYIIHTQVARLLCRIKVGSCFSNGTDYQVNPLTGKFIMLAAGFFIFRESSLQHVLSAGFRFYVKVDVTNEVRHQN